VHARSLRLECSVRAEDRDDGTVRAALPEEARAIARVHVASWRSAYRGLMPDALLTNLSVERRTRMWDAILAHPETDVFVSELTGELVGFIMVGPCHDEDLDARSVGEVMIYLLEHAWGLGLGRRMWEAGMTALRRRGRATVSLWVLDTNDRARGFYERMGLAADGRDKIEEWDGFGLHEVRYQGSLEGVELGSESH